MLRLIKRTFAGLAVLIAMAPFSVFAASQFTRTLTLGMRGSDVLALQVFLNSDSDTQVAQTGAGSPGNETGYFDPATQAALARFQEKYRADILVPAGLSRGTGIFGEKTRAKVAALQLHGAAVAQSVAATTAAASQSTPAAPTPLVGAAVAPVPVPWTPDLVVPQGVNPNSVNLEYMISVVDKRGKDQGMSDKDLATVENAIRAEAATTTDLTKQFLQTANIKQADVRLFGTPVALEEENPIAKVLIALGVVTVAHAAFPVPFGGTVAAAVPCTCTPGAWLVTFAAPLPPSMAEILTYISGSQMFLSYVPVPHTAQSYLGYYSAGVPACWMIATPCVPVPTWGTITPFVGSSF